VAEDIHLKGKEPEVDRDKVGISYSGGGALVLVELGIARAFVSLGIRPAVITGVSAGALAGAAHALDPVGGRGIRLAADILAHVSNSLLGLTPVHVLGRLVVEREHITSLGDNATIGPLITAGLKREFGLDNVTIGYFKPPDRPTLMILATDILNRLAVWFPDSTALEDAVVASSSIPGVFPWRKLVVDGQERYLADGGVVMNQPLSNLVEQGCGTLYVCAVGSTQPFAPPRNALENAFRSINLSMHQSMKLEEDYVAIKLNGKGVVHHIHPIINDISGDNFDFTPQMIEDVMADAEAQTIKWLSGEES
jgi:predicted acylesterase/phospholipase RssA